MDTGLRCLPLTPARRHPPCGRPCRATDGQCPYNQLHCVTRQETKTADSKQQKLLEDMKKGGLDKATAQKVLTLLLQL